MKSTFIIAAAALSFVAPVSSFAQQSNGAVTRAQIKAELAELERAGYDHRDWNHYPDHLQAALRRVDAQRADSTGTQAQ